MKPTRIDFLVELLNFAYGQQRVSDDLRGNGVDADVLRSFDSEPLVLLVLQELGVPQDGGYAHYLEKWYGEIVYQGLENQVSAFPLWVISELKKAGIQKAISHRN